MKKTYALLLALLCSCHFRFDRALEPGELRGKVVFEGTGGARPPAAGAHIVLEGSSVTATADAKGRFLIRGMKPGSWSLSITGSQSANGRADSGIRLQNLVITDDDGTAGGLDVGQVVLAAFGDIAGTVDHAGAPANGPTAVLAGIGQQLVSSGTFAFSSLLPGDYDLSVVADVDGTSHLFHQAVHVLSRKTTQVPPIHLEDMPRASSGSISGSVSLLGADSSAGVDVTLSCPTVSAEVLPPLVTVGDEGRFTATDLPVGVYTVTASVDGFAPVTVSSIVVGGATTVPVMTLLPNNDPSVGGQSITDGAGGSGGSSFAILTTDQRIQRACENAALCGGLTPFNSVDECVQRFEAVETDLGDLSECRATANDLMAMADCLGSSACSSYQSIACAAPQIAFAIEAERNELCSSRADDLLGKIFGDGRDESLRGRPVVPPSTVVTLSGNGQQGFYEGTGGAVGSARLNGPAGIAVDNEGFAYVADRLNQRIRRIDAWGDVATIAGDGFEGSMDGPASREGGAEFAYPSAVALDSSGNVFIADSSNNKIRKLAPDGMVSTLAGSGRPGFADGTGTGASFNGPMGLVIDSSGNLLVADAFNNRIRRISPEGVVTTVAGSGMPGLVDGPAMDAQLFRPVAIAFDAQANLLVVDQGNHCVRRIDHQTSAVTTFAGTGQSGTRNGTVGEAQFKDPAGIALDARGTVFVTDTGNHRVQRIADGAVSTLAGAGADGFSDGSLGAAGTAQFRAPTGIAIDDSGLLYVTDAADNRIRLIRQ